ncbi:MAG TPA: hypothetical protein PLP01_16885 [Phycisphaerae bacterium]|nr:hypothetical protein [Phycisphaerae bacterium]HOI56929.1 hypothetical protein [Phycisphaerae bacterium]
MRYWRMAFRAGYRGKDFSYQCLDKGVAAITYGAIYDVDMTGLPIGEPKEEWNELEGPQKCSMRCFIHEMKPGDIIYAKGDIAGTPRRIGIVGRGTICGPYEFDKRGLICETLSDGEACWRHIRRVRWDPNFHPIPILLGTSQQFTVQELIDREVRKAERFVTRERAQSDRQSAVEGAAHRREVLWRQRNRALINSRKASSDYCCEVCGFHFEETYGDLGRGFVIAHHEKALGKRQRASRTCLKDIRLLCANCHNMIHRNEPMLTVEQLKRRIRKE